MLEQILSTLIPFIPIAIIAIIVVIILVAAIKVASGNEVLVVTGVGATKKVTKKVKVIRNGKEVEEEQTTYVPKIKVAGAAVVIPFIQQSRRFDICVKKAKKDNDTMKTKTGVEIIIDWSISYAPNADSIETLQPCIRQFLDKDAQETEDIVMSSVAGGMRAVISTMTPQQVMVGKETLDEAVQKNIAEQMAELGYKVQIYIQEVRDAHNSTYYHDLAAEDREKTRQNAAMITAEANQAIREREALAEQTAKQAELNSEVAIAERQRDADIKRANFKAETDKAAADAAIAGELRTTERNQELIERRGTVKVEEQKQNQLAAEAAQKVAVTEAETAKKQAIIAAQAEAEKRQIDADADAAVAEKNALGKAKAAEATAEGNAKVAEAEARGKANAAKTRAEGDAEAKKLEAVGDSDAAKTRAEGDATAIRLKAEADAERICATGKAEAEAISAKGKAEAEAIEAKGKAEAEAARALSDAQAANDRVNFEISKLEIQRDVQISIATSVAEVMAKIGTNAKFVDFGGSSANDGQDLLTRVMGNIPGLLAKLNLQSDALNGQSFPETLRALANSLTGKELPATAEDGAPKKTNNDTKPKD